MPELIKLLRTKSTMRYFPPKGTAGLARSLVSGYRRVPFPPARTIPSTRSRIVSSQRLLYRTSGDECDTLSAMQATATPAVTPTSDARRWGIMGLLCIGMIIAYVDRTNFSIALAADDFKSLFRLTDADRGHLSAAFFWSYAFLQIPAGWVVDRYGIKYPFALAFLVWSLVSAGTALATTVSALFALRFVLGVGESVVTPAGMRWIRFNFPEHRRGLALGLYMAAAKVGPAVGAWIAAILLQGYGWKPMFLILGLGSM